MAISISERAQAVTRAKNALTKLHQHPATSRDQLGHARWHLNRIYTHNDPAFLVDAVQGVEAIVLEVYGGHPDH